MNNRNHNCFLQIHEYHQAYHHYYFFDSVVIGHIFHARCLTGLMLGGKCCPVDGCNERLFSPNVTRVNNDDETCCGGAGNDSRAEDEALQAALDFAGHSSIYEDRIAEGATVATSTGRDQLKMCPNVSYLDFIHHQILM